MKYISFFLFGCALISCDSSQQHDNQLDKDQIANEVKEMLHLYHEDMNNEGLLSEFKHLDNSDEFFWVPPGYLSSIDYDSVKTVIEGAAPGLSSVNYSWSSLKIFPLHQDIASFTGIVSGMIIDTSGTQTDVTLIESGTVIRRDDGWKLLNGQSRFLQ